MLPTYVLPYFGSNSSAINLVSAGLGLGPTPFWWLHLWALLVLIVIAWIRGGWIGKRYLMAFPFAATIFDLVPGLNMVPLVPTFFHVCALAVGIKAVSSSGVFEYVGPGSKLIGVILSIFTLVCGAGAISFGFKINDDQKSDFMDSKPAERKNSLELEQSGNPKIVPAAEEKNAPAGDVATKPKSLELVPKPAPLQQQPDQSLPSGNKAKPSLDNQSKSHPSKNPAEKGETVRYMRF